MRKQAFRYNVVKDIGYYVNDKMVCTSTLGILDEPFEGIAPAIVGVRGVQMWVDVPLLLLESNANAFVAKLGDFNMVFNFKEGGWPRSDIYDWEVVAFFENRVNHVAGQRNVYNFDHVEVAPKYGEPSWEAQFIHKCSPTVMFCAAVRQNNAEFFFQTHIVLWTLFLSGIGAIVGYLSMLTFISHQRSLITRIAKGMSPSRFYYLYQPIIDLHTGAICGCEVLSRFEDGYGAIHPDEFIPVVRDMGLTWSFTENVVAGVLNELHVNDSPDFKMSINIFPADVLSGDVRKLLSKTDLLAAFPEVCLEVIEDQYLEKKIALENICQLLDAGFTIAIDDFGTGYSNFKQLNTLPFTYLKIDRRFVEAMEDESIKSCLIPHIVSIADQLNMKIIAEGVELTRQKELLKSLGVKYAQGLLFGKPMPSKEFLAMLVISKSGIPRLAAN